MNQLLEILELQRRWPELLMTANRLKDSPDLAAASAAYERLVALEKQLLEKMLKFNQAPPTGEPFDVAPVASSLINSVSIWADVVEAMDDRARAQALRDEGMDTARRYLSGVAIADRERQSAAALKGQGKFNQALVALTNARDLMQREGRVLDTAAVAADLADLLEWLGDFDRALLEAGRAESLIRDRLQEIAAGQESILNALNAGQFKQAEERAALLKISLSIDQLRARICRFTGRWDDSERLFQKAFPNVPTVAQPAIVYQIAAIRVGQGRVEEGLALARQLQPAFTGLLKQKLGVLLRLQAQALLALGKPAEALPILDQAVLAFQQFYDPDSLWRVHELRGRALAALQKPQDALAAWLEAANLVNGLRKAPLGYRLDSTYLSEKLPMFRSAIELAAAEQPALCCRLMEMIKSRILTATLSVVADSAGGETAELDSRLDELRRELDAVEYAAFAEGWTDTHRKKRDALFNERAELLERRRFSEPRWRAITEPTPFDLAQVQHNLVARDQAALALFYRPHCVTAVLLYKGRTAAATWELPREVPPRLQAYLENFQATKPNPDLFDLSGEGGVNADDLLPEELLSEALQAGSLVIVPHGPLHLVPWAGLRFQGKRLFEYCPVGIQPNLSCLVLAGGELSRKPKVALLGAADYSNRRGLADLAGAEAELGEIAEIFGEPGRLLGQPLTRARATRAAFRDLMRNPEAARSVLHLACHAGFEAGEPMFSGLELADGKIDAAEIARSRVPFEEVVLSACCTGQRPLAVQQVELLGDDILGLPGAFLEGGVKSVLVSIPPAEDKATARLMTLYYENRVEGTSPLSALQSAQKTMLAEQEYPPSLWVGFTAYGNQ